MIDSPLLPLRQNDERESRDPAGGGFPGLQKTPEMFPFRAFSKAILPFVAEGSNRGSSECRGAIDRWQKNRQLLFGRNYPQPSAFNPFLKELCNALGHHPLLRRYTALRRGEAPFRWLCGRCQSLGSAPACSPPPGSNPHRESWTDLTSLERDLFRLFGYNRYRAR